MSIEALSALSTESRVLGFREFDGTSHLLSLPFYHFRHCEQARVIVASGLCLGQFLPCVWIIFAKTWPRRWRPVTPRPKNVLEANNEDEIKVSKHDITERDNSTEQLHSLASPKDPNQGMPSAAKAHLLFQIAPDLSSCQSALVIWDHVSKHHKPIPKLQHAGLEGAADKIDQNPTARML